MGRHPQSPVPLEIFFFSPAAVHPGEPLSSLIFFSPSTAGFHCSPSSPFSPIFCSFSKLKPDQISFFSPSDQRRPFNLQPDNPFLHLRTTKPSSFSRRPAAASSTIASIARAQPHAGPRPALLPFTLPSRRPPASPPAISSSPSTAKPPNRRQPRTQWR